MAGGHGSPFITMISWAAGQREDEVVRPGFETHLLTYLDVTLSQSDNLHTVSVNNGGVDTKQEIVKAFASPKVLKISVCDCY